MNFEFHNPTRLIFGARTLSQLGEVASNHGRKALIVTNEGYPVHMIEHTLPAYHGITHVAGLSAINPSWMRFTAKSHPAKFVQFAERIFGLKAKGAGDLDCALQGIDRFEAFLKSIDCPTRLSELDIDDSLITRYAQDTLRIIHDENDNLPARPAMTEADIVAVLSSAL